MECAVNARRGRMVRAASPLLASLHTLQWNVEGLCIARNIAPDALVPREILGPRLDALFTARFAQVLQAGLDGLHHGGRFEILEIFCGLSTNFRKAGERREKNRPAKIHCFYRRQAKPFGQGGHEQGFAVGVQPCFL